MGLQISLRETKWPLGPINKFQRNLLVLKPNFKVPEEHLGLWVFKISFRETYCPLGPTNKF